MRSIIRALLAVFVVTLGVTTAAPAFAGSPHFVGAPTVTVDGSTLTVTGKEAGLGDEADIHVELVATAECINGGGKHPKAVNKASFQTGGQFPVQNGKAIYDISVTAVFQPDCAPPMTVQWTSVTLTDTTNNISVTLRL